MTVKEYILKMKSITHALMAVSHAIYDDKLILYIRGGLGLEYEYVVVHLTF